MTIARAHGDYQIASSPSQTDQNTAPKIRMPTIAFTHWIAVTP